MSHARGHRNDEGQRKNHNHRRSRGRVNGRSPQSVLPPAVSYVTVVNNPIELNSCFGAEYACLKAAEGQKVLRQAGDEVGHPRQVF